jgi:hypothetical protein
MVVPFSTHTLPGAKVIPLLSGSTGLGFDGVLFPALSPPPSTAAVQLQKTPVSTMMGTKHKNLGSFILNLQKLIHNHIRGPSCVY